MLTSRDIVFATDVPPSARGATQIPLDLAVPIAHILDPKKKPKFIRPQKIANFLRKDKGPLVVAINPRRYVLSAFESCKRLFTIGIQSFDKYEDAVRCNICLNPCFNPLNFQEKSANGNEPLTINFTYTPSRMRPSTKMKWFDPVSSPSYQSEADASSPQPKTIAIYYRSSVDDISNLMRDTKVLNRRYGYRFLVSTGPNTTHDEAMRLKNHFVKLSGTEFCHYRSETNATSSARLEKFFARANAIIVSKDSISTLSDAISTGKPVYLFGDEQTEQLLRDGYYAPWDIRFMHDLNFPLQLALFRQNRLKVFSVENIQSDWRPYYNDDWADIAGQIAGVIKDRLHELGHPAPA